MTSLAKHLEQRHCLASMYGPSVDSAERVVTFYLWNLTGQLVGYQQYRPDAKKEMRNHPREGRYYTRLGEEGDSVMKRTKHKIGVFGLESFHFPGPLYVVEGIFDAASIHCLQKPAIAVLQNDPKRLRPWISALGRETVAVCDGDQAGKKLAKLCDRAIFLPADRDANDMSIEELKDLLDG